MTCLIRRYRCWGVAVNNTITERPAVQFLNFGLKVPALFVEESLAIRDKELHITDLRAINGGLVDFVQYAVR